jgi:hypothetical protein
MFLPPGRLTYASAQNAMCHHIVFYSLCQYPVVSAWQECHIRPERRASVDRLQINRSESVIGSKSYFIVPLGTITADTKKDWRGLCLSSIVELHSFKRIFRLNHATSSG